MNPESVLTIYTQDLFQLEDLEAGFIETLLIDGPAQWLAEMPFEQSYTKLYAFNYERALPVQQFVADPIYSCENVIEPVWGQRMVDIRHFRADTRVATLDIDAYGQTNPKGYARARKIAKVGKEMTWSMLEYFMHGTGACLGTHGVDHWIDWWADVTVPAGANTFGKHELIVPWTEEGTVGGTKKPLSIDAMRDLLSRVKCGDFGALYCDRESVLALRHLYDNMGGNTAPMILYEWYDSAGRRRAVQSATQFDGVPVFQYDVIGKEKVYIANATGALTVDDSLLLSDTYIIGLACLSNEVVINNFIGFSSVDVGRQVKLYDDAGAEVAPQLAGKEIVITEVVDAYTVKVMKADASSFSAGEQTDIEALTDLEGAKLVVQKTNLIYALNFGPNDIYGFYVDTEGMGFDGGMCLGSVAGFTIREIGLDHSCEFIRDRLVWYGNTVMKNPWAAGRLQGYTLPQFNGS